MSRIDYRHVEYMPHGHIPGHAAAASIQPREEEPVLPGVEEAVLKEQSIAPPLNPNTAKHVASPTLSSGIPEGAAAAAAAVPITNSPTSLVLQVPRPIPTDTALRMLRTFIETILFMRGQIPTTWQILQRTLNQERQKIDCQPSSTDSATLRSSPTANPALIRKLEGLLGPAEEIFTALGDAVMREQRQRAETRSTEMLVISVAFILGSTLSTPKELYRIDVGPILPFDHCSPPSSSSSSSSGILQPTVALFQNSHIQKDEVSQREENEWIRRLAQLMITDGYDYATPTLPRTRVHVALKAAPGAEVEGLVPRQTLVLPGDNDHMPEAFAQVHISTSNHGHHHQSPLPEASNMPPPPCPSTARYPVYTCQILGPNSFQSEPDSGVIYTMQSTLPPATSIWYQAGPSLPVPPNLD